MEQESPRTVVKALLRGVQPIRPLLMPLSFALASRIDNLALDSFVSNPTKIVNALRQIRATLRLDGVTCYFDPLLEIEALGGKVECKRGGRELVVFREFADADWLRAQCGSADQILSRGRVPIVAEVLRRLKTVMKDDPALVVGITGPLKMAAQLAGASPENVATNELAEFTAEITAALAKYFVEAGADMVLVMESLPPTANAEMWDWWRSLLDPVINVIRFYEALPALLLDETLSDAQASKLLDRSWECTICLPAALLTELAAVTTTQELGITLPAKLFDSAAGATRVDMAAFRTTVEQVRPVLVTTTGDLPANADLKQVARSLGQFRQALSFAA
jgi:Uroporphyrinogen decarboxylase (URO-D)